MGTILKSDTLISKDKKNLLIPTPININVFAPLTGLVVPLEGVPDPVFSARMVGDGIAIDPVDGNLYSPIAGRVVLLHPAHHAITIENKDGVQILMHIGIDSVQLKGKGFHPLVKQGDQVKIHQKLIEFDLDYVAQNCKSLISPILVVEPSNVNLDKTCEDQVCSGKDFLLKVISSASLETMEIQIKDSKEVRSEAICIFDPTGLHARPASVIVNVAKKYNSKIDLEYHGQRANAKSVVGIMGLEVLGNQEVYFIACGGDAEMAIDQLSKELNKQMELAYDNIKSLIQDKNIAIPAEINNDPNVLVGVSASPGLAVGKILQLKSESLNIPEKGESQDKEEKKLEQAIHAAKEQLEVLHQQVQRQADSGKAAIFSAHKELMEDPDLLELVFSNMKKDYSAAKSWKMAIDIHAGRLEKLTNELLAARANDLKDVGDRVLRILLGVKTRKIQAFDNTILIAEQLSPSDTASLDRDKIIGFCTTTGGAVSHVAILARSLGIPAIAGIDGKALEITDGTQVILNGSKGQLRLNPNQEQITEAKNFQQQQAIQRKKDLEMSLQPANTLDGKHIEVAANIGGISDAKEAVLLGCEGVGLLRSEFLFLERETAPTEEEQLQIYQEIADILDDRPLTIRTLDVGGDKPLAYLPFPEEENPFLGEKGLRFCLAHPELFKTQLRAILRVKSRGELRIMFPMVADIHEVRQAKKILEEERIKLGVPAISVGIMIEIPSAALIAESLAQEVDFFSIGTNDLTQYAMAMDRGHPKLAAHMDGLHPGVLRLIEFTVKGAKKHDKWVGVCGGIASDHEAVSILIGLGVDELSVSIPSIPSVKAKIRMQNTDQCKSLASQSLLLESAKKVRQLVETQSN